MGKGMRPSPNSFAIKYGGMAYRGGGGGGLKKRKKPRETAPGPANLSRWLADSLLLPLHVLQHHYDSQRRDHADKSEQERARVPIKSDDRAGNRSNQEERHIGERGINAQSGPAIDLRKPLHGFHAYRREYKRKA